jgi:hypothetical protein
VGLKPFARLVCFLAALALAGTASATSAADRAAAYLQGHQTAGGGFAEPGRNPDPGLTAWAVLGLAAAGRPPAGAAAYLSDKSYPTATDLALRVLALAALGRDVSGLVSQLEGLRKPSGRIGPAINSTAWGVLALRAAGRTVRPATRRFLLRAQASNGGWSWIAGVAPDCDDTAAVIEALRAAGVGAQSKPIRRGIAYLRARQNQDGGFEASAGRGSNAQSTAWAIQALVAAGRDPGNSARAYLGRLQRSDGSFRFSARYATTPVWVTAQALPALLLKPFPLRARPDRG